MGKLYTLDGKMLTETPELRVGEKIYPIDNRQKTVAKLMSVTQGFKKDGSAEDSTEGLYKVMELAFGKAAAKEIDDANIPYPAQLRLLELVMAAVTGEEPDEVDKRFQAAQKAGN